MKKKLLFVITSLLLVSCSDASKPIVSPSPTSSFITPTSGIEPTTTPSEPTTSPVITPSKEEPTPSISVLPTPSETPTPTPTNVFNKTTVEYTLVQRVINGFEVPTHLLEIKLKSLTDLHSCFATDKDGNYGVNITDSLQNVVNKTKEEKGIDILGAVNGDYTFSSETRKGYSVKDGIIYRTERRSRNSVDLVFKKDNTVSIMKEGEFQLDGEIGDTSDIYWQVIGFGPLLAENSQMVVDETAELGGNTWVNNQRTCIGIIDWNHFYLMSTEANDRRSKTLQSYRLYDLGVMLLEYGCHTVYNLDGGYSSGLAYENEVKFAPSRKISDIIYIVNE